MPAAFLLSDFAILPTTVPESFGRAAVEPQAMGRTVIAAAHGGTMETVVDGETGWLAAPGDAGAWGDALARAIDLGPEGRARMGEVAMARARALYRVEAMCDATLKAYERLLETQG
jgi:glycosyltransferase involved in cell wall biosynthesis